MTKDRSNRRAVSAQNSTTLTRGTIKMINRSTGTAVLTSKSRYRIGGNDQNWSWSASHSYTGRVSSASGTISKSTTYSSNTTHCHHHQKIPRKDDAAILNKNRYI